MSEAKRSQMAYVVGASFVALTVAALAFGRTSGPSVELVFPIAATLCAACDLITAVLLLSRFAVLGEVLVAFVGTAFLMNGLLEIPYVAAIVTLLNGSSHVLPQAPSMLILTS
jgi:hypothetical protein